MAFDAHPMRLASNMRGAHNDLLPSSEVTAYSVVSYIA